MSAFHSSSSSFDLSLSLFVFCFLLQIGFSIVIEFAGFGHIGIVSSAAIVWLDLVVLLWMYGQRDRTPLQACLLLACIRFFIIIFGPTYYLVGHTCLFILLACYFTYHLIDRFAPLSKLRETTDDEEEIVPDGYAPINLLQATAVKQEVAGNAKTRAAAEKRRQRETRRQMNLNYFNVR